MTTHTEPRTSTGMATAGNNRKVHLIAYDTDEGFHTLCGLDTPKRPQTTQDTLPKCRRCFGKG